MSREYKASKEAFVSGMSGSTVGHINMISAVALSSIALHSALRSRLPPSKSIGFPLEWLILVAPLLLSLTVFANSPTILSLMLLAPTAILLLSRRRESGTPLPSSSSEHSTQSGFTNTNSIIVMPIPAVTIYRAHMLLMTMISILAVDFPVFPRSLVKCETFGVSIMDLGVGSFVFSQGLVSAIPLLKNPSYLASPMGPKIANTLRKTWPVLALGIIRVILVKGTDYPEHETEYGTHWNFFITLALLPILQVFLHPVIARFPISLIGVACAAFHQLLLSYVGFKDYVLHAPRTNIISANKEGLVSITGYLAVHLLGLSAGTVILPPSPNYFRHQQQARTRRQRKNSIDDDDDPKNAKITVQRQEDKTAIELFSYAVVWWFLMFVSDYTKVGGGVSRRLVSLPYILWVAAYNVTFILGYLTLDLVFFPSPLSKSVYSPVSKLKVQVDSSVESKALQSRKAPQLLEAVNRNGLVLFLLANVATGIINMGVSTMYTSDTWAMVMLSGYSVGICAVAWMFRHSRIWRL